MTDELTLPPSFLFVLTFTSTCPGFGTGLSTSPMYSALAGPLSPLILTARLAHERNGRRSAPSPFAGAQASFCSHLLGCHGCSVTD